jgi:hypothetical protein
MYIYIYIYAYIAYINTHTYIYIIKVTFESIKELLLEGLGVPVGEDEDKGGDRYFSFQFVLYLFCLSF